MAPATHRNNNKEKYSAVKLLGKKKKKKNEHRSEGEMKATLTRNIFVGSARSTP